MAAGREVFTKALVPQKRIQTFLTHGEEETLRVAEAFGRKLRPGSVVALTGEIGSGKTVFIKGLARGLGVEDSNQVKSPTFVWLHLYKGRLPIHHFDLYRLENEADLEAIGFDDYLADRMAVSLVEWADRAPRRIPRNSFRVEIKITGHTSRTIQIRLR